MPARRVLCARRGALGDTLLIVPALRMLRERFAGAAIELAGNLDHAQVLAHYGVVDRAFSTEDLRLWDADAARARIAREWDAACLEGEHFDPRIGADCKRSAAEELLHRVAAAVGWTGPLDATAGLVASRPRELRADLLVLAPGAGATRKRAPLARFADLAARARAGGRPVAVVLGPTEADDGYAAEVLRAMPPGCEVWAGLSAVQLAERLAPAGAFVGNDSGVTHLAAALLVPTSAIFTATDPRIWAPRGAHVRVMAC